MKRALVSVLAVLTAGQVWAAGFQSKQVSSSATWVVHADVEKLRQTQVGGFILGKLNEGEAANKLAAFAAVFGFDPRKDLNTVTLYGKSKDPAQSVVLAGGTFNGDQLVTLLKANNTYESQAYGTYTIHSWIDEKKPNEGRQYGCLHPGGTILISHGADMLKEALDVLDGKQAGLDTAKVFGGALLADAPFFMAGANISQVGDVRPDAAVLKQAAGGQMALAEKDGSVVLAVAVTANSLEAATNMQSVAQGMVAMAQLGQEKNPELARIAQATRISRDGNTVRLDLTYPVNETIALLEAGMAKRAQFQAAHGAQTPQAH